MSFNDFDHKHNLKTEPTSNIKIQKVLGSVGLEEIGIYITDGLFKSDIRIVNLYPSQRTHWVVNINENFLIRMVVLHLKNYLNSIQNKTNFESFLNTKYKD